MIVDPTHYEAASERFGIDLANGLTAAYDTLMNDLSGTGGMAGADAAALAWADNYQGSAGSAVDCLKTLQATSLKLATMLQRTGFNHASAESASGPVDHGADGQDYTARSSLMLSCRTVPAAEGGGGRPNLLSEVETACGQSIDWANGRPGRLRTASTAWTSAARSLALLTGYVDSAVAQIGLQTSPEVADATTVCSAMKTHVQDLVWICGQLAAACDAHADAVQKFQDDAGTRMSVLRINQAVGDVLGALVTEATFGLSDMVAQGLDFAEAAITGHFIIADLHTYTAASTMAQIPLADVSSTATDIATLVAPILAATLTAAVVAAVPDKNASVAQKTLFAAETNLIVLAGTGRRNIFVGGHAIDKHVGRSDRQLVERDIPFASTFLTFEVAQRSTERNIADNSAKIKKWLSGNDKTLTLVGKIAPGSGRTYIRASGHLVDSTVVTTVLTRRGDSYVVLTSFPDI